MQETPSYGRGSEREGNWSFNSRNTIDKWLIKTEHGLFLQ